MLECDDSEATIDTSGRWEDPDVKGWEETSSCSAPENYNGSTHNRYFQNLLPGNVHKFKSFCYSVTFGTQQKQGCSFA